jgi:hypothetical protein
MLDKPSELLAETDKFIKEAMPILKDVHDFILNNLQPKE